MMNKDDERIVHCHNCLKEMKASDGICPNCGFDMKQYWAELYQQVYAKKEKPKKEDSVFNIIKRLFKTTFIFILVCVIVAIIYTGVTPGSTYTNNEKFQANISYGSETYDKANYPVMLYESVLRDPDKHKNIPYSITGIILQEVPADEKSFVYFRMSTKYEDYIGYSGNEIIVMVNIGSGSKSYDLRPIEGDVVTVYGVCAGDMSYTTVLNATKRVPILFAKWIDVNE